jgi:hypothetical protein
VAGTKAGQAIGLRGLPLRGDDSRQKPIDCPTFGGHTLAIYVLKYGHLPLCYTTGLWQASPSRGIIIIIPRDGRCNNFHQTNGKDARRENGGLFLFLR